jgi:hypothetical protein
MRTLNEIKKQKKENMGVKKIARPINKAKNSFIKWLEKNKAEDIDVFSGVDDNDWDYYKHVYAFIGKKFYIVCFTMWQGVVKIDYYDSENRYNDMSIDEFMELLN